MVIEEGLNVLDEWMKTMIPNENKILGVREVLRGREG